MANALFYLTAVGTIACSLGVILSRNPIKAVLSLLGSFFCLATIYLLAGFQFLAAAQILVYAGAIMVLFLFVIMLLNLGEDSRSRIIDTDVLRQRRLGVPGIVAGALFAAGLIAIGAAKLPQSGFFQGEGGIGTPAELAEHLFFRHVLAFQGAGVLLLVTTVAVLVLAKRERTPRTIAGRVDVSERQAELAELPPPPLPTPRVAESLEHEVVLGGGTHR